MIVAALLCTALASGGRAPAALLALHPAMADDTTWTAPAVRFVRALAIGRTSEAAALVAPASADKMGAARLREIWTQLTGQLGELVELRPLDVTTEDGLHTASLAARFARSSVTLQVVLSADRRVSGFWVSQPRAVPYEPPSYVRTAAFAEHDITLGDGPTALPATVTSPRSAGPHPVVVLVHGSGPNDRNETVGANRPFQDLAWGLASRGVAVLRYEKRTRAHPTQYAAGEWNMEREVIADALLAVAAARAEPGADPARVFVLGHSLGGSLAPEIAGRDPRVRGVVLLAGAARPNTELLDEQLRYLDSLQGSPSPAERDALLARVRALGARTLPPAELVLGAPASYWYEWAEHDGPAAARRLGRPALVLQGGRDYQVTERDLAVWREAFVGNTHARFNLYADLNHLFMTGSGKSTPAEYQGPAGHVADRVVADIAQFVRDTR